MGHLRRVTVIYVQIRFFKNSFLCSNINALSGRMFLTNRCTDKDMCIQTNFYLLNNNDTKIHLAENNKNLVIVTQTANIDYQMMKRASI